MATMLGFIFTEAAVDAAFLQQMLGAANRQSYSCITVDGDTSTSDTVLAFATGKAGNAPLTSVDDPGAGAFQAALTDLCIDRKSTRLNSRSLMRISYAVFCLKKKT